MLFNGKFCPMLPCYTTDDVSAALNSNKTELYMDVGDDNINERKEKHHVDDNFSESNGYGKDLSDIWDETYGFHAKIGAKVVIIGILVYFSIGIIAFSFVFEHWDIVDSVYFSIVTFTTIGFGDLYPTTPNGMLFTCFYAFGGVAFVGVVFGEKASHLVDQELGACNIVGHKVLGKMLNLDDEESSAKEKSTLYSAIPYEDKEDKMNKKWLIYEYLPYILGTLFIIAMVLLGAFHIGNESHWEWKETLYFAMILSSTIGYGDYKPLKKHRAFACFYILFTFGVSTHLFGALVRSILRRRRKKILDHFQSVKLKWKELQDMDHDGKISRGDYIEYMLTSMNIVEKDMMIALNERFDSQDYTKDVF